MMTFLRRCLVVLVRTTMPAFAALDIADVRIRPVTGRGVVIVANHRSILDLGVGLVAFQRWGVTPVVFIRESLFRIPGVAGVLRSIGGIPAGPRSAVGAMRRARQVLREGGVVVIMPEGRVPWPRERVEGLAPLMSGAGRLASTVGAQVLLVGMLNSDAVWPRGRVVPRLALFSSRRPTVTLSVQWLQIKQGSTHREITADIRSGLVELLRSAEAARALSAHGKVTPL